MKRLLLPVFAISALVLGSCSTQKVAQQGGDDVYFTEAKAKEVTFAVRQERQEERSYRTDEQLYGGGDYATDRYYDDYNYDYGYASRISRFYGRSSWRSAYYDSWYAYGYYPWYTYRYDPFYYDPWYYRPGVSVWVGLGTYPRYGWYDNNYWGYYGSPYASNYWGPYSYYNVYPGTGYYGGYYSSGRNNPNYRPRPSRGGSDVYGPSNRGTIITGGQPRNSSNGRTSSTDEANRPTSRPRPSGPDYNSPRSTPSTSSTRESQPSTRAERPAPAERSAPAPAPSNSGGSSGGGGGDNSRSRPSRGGN